ncbi:unnamed protein product [Cladocopium goreaui]|uniref:EF-hand domain-containing protein n=1 Tax=Cladocopium goreaui TaxID=2562237 RepID=A0A9P1CHW3_9DINO|nr:unnamed protein product [Cladocopium goreaui]
MRCQDELRTFLQCLMMPPSPASKPVPSKTCKREAPRAHLRLDLPFDHALETLTARVVQAEMPVKAPVSGQAEGPKLRRPSSSNRGGHRQKRARSAVGRKVFNNPFAQWTRVPPESVGVIYRRSASPDGSSRGPSPKREAWGSEGKETSESKPGDTDINADEVDVLRPRLYPKASKRGSSKPYINQARSSSRSRQKNFAQSFARRGSDNSSVSGLSAGFSRRTSENAPNAPLERKRSKGSQVNQAIAGLFGVPEMPEVKVEEENRSKDFTEQALSTKLSLPLEVAKQAAECFRNHAQCEPSDRPDLWRLRRSDFENVLCELCSVGQVGELPIYFVSQVFRLADMTRSGDLDLEEFISWYATFSFSEELLLGKSTKSVRDVARRMGINLLDIERYKKVFDSYDTNKSGVLEIGEFRQLLNRLLKVPAGHHLPNSQVKSFWTMADRNGNGVIDFPEFCKFYLRNLVKNGEDYQLSDMYRGIRNVSVGPSGRPIAS